MNKGRGYMSKPDQHFYKVVGLFFCPYLSALSRGNRPLFMWSIPHLCGYAKTEYGGSPSTCFFALCGGSHVCCSRRGSASRFFRTPTSTVPDGFGDKATTYMICKQLHQFSAQLICAR